MMGRVLLVVALLASAVCAQTTAPITAPALDSLLNELAAEEFSTRRKAAEQIAALGKEVIPQLEVHLKQSSNEEVRTALETAIAKIRENDAFGPTLITATFKTGSAQQVFEELARQSGIEIRMAGNDGWDRLVEKRDLSFNRTPFWQALIDACDAFGVGFSMPSKSILLMPGGQVSKFRATAGPFLFLAESITRSSNSTRNLAGQQGEVNSSTNLSLQVRVHGEPRASTQAIEVAVEEARDDLGNDLRPATGDPVRGRTFNFGSRGAMRLMPIRLSTPEKPGSKIVRLSGKTSLQMVSKSQVVEIPDILNAEPKDHVIPGGVLRFEKLEKKGGIFMIRITGQVGNAWNSGVLQDIQLVDAQGRALRNAGRSSSTNGNSIELELRFMPMPEINFDAPQERGEAPGEPVKLTVNIPVDTRQIELPFEFKDIPMP